MFRDSAPPAAGVVAIIKPQKVVGRERELARLHDYLQQSFQGERQIVFVTGEVGIGKSTLVDLFLEQAEGPETCIARGQCMESYGVPEAFYPVLEAVGQLLQAPGSEPLLELLSSKAPSWLVQ